MASKQPPQADYVEFGSERHAALLSLRKLEKGEETEHAYKGYTLVDPTAWGPNARPEFIQAQLVQRVNEFLTKPAAPADAPKMWTPAVQPE